MIRISCGDFEIKEGENSYIFRPTFFNCLKLGTPKESVELFSDVFMVGLSSYDGYIQDIYKQHSKRVLPASLQVLQSCCGDDITHLIGEFVESKGKIKYKSGLVPIKDIVTLAKHLLTHMMIGKPDESESKKGEYSEDFDVSKFVDIAILHLGISENEALQLSMTRFQEMFKIKFPTQASAEPSDKEYDEAMELLERANKARQ